MEEMNNKSSTRPEQMSEISNNLVYVYVCINVLKHIYRYLL